MKHIKLYEELNDKPKVGDYVICVCDINNNYHEYEFVNYMENNIGVICKDTGGIFQQYYVKYENTPFNLFRGINSSTDNYNGYWWFDKSEIKFHSSNKEDLRIHIDAKKYNI